MTESVCVGGGGGGGGGGREKLNYGIRINGLKNTKQQQQNRSDLEKEETEDEMIIVC